MTKRERVMAALAGQEVDRVPIAFWVHNFAKENTARDLAEETARFVRTYDWDFAKVQSRASYFAEGWGNRYAFSTEPAVGPRLISHAFETVSELGRLERLPIEHPVLAEQQEALRLTRELLGPDVPIIWTIFCPLTIAASLVSGGAAAIHETMQSDPATLLSALDAIAATYAELSDRYVSLGADGIFYASKWVGPRMLTRDEHARFARPFDLRILGAVRGAPFTILHLCGEEIYFADFGDYPAAAVNWAPGNGNPALAEACRLTDRALLGGVSPKPEFAELTPARVAAQVSSAIAATNGRHVLVGPGCSVNPGAPPANYRAAREAVDEERKT